MKFLFLLAFLIFPACHQDKIETTLSEISFSETALKSLSKEKLDTLSKDPEVRFRWKRALVKRVLEENVEKVEAEATQSASDAFMAQAESELTQPNGIEISGVVFYVAKAEQEKRSDAEKAALEAEIKRLANLFRQDLLIDPSDDGLRRLYQETKTKLTNDKRWAGIKLNLKFETKILARFEVSTAGWLFIADVLDSHKDSYIDGVAETVQVGSSFFVTILRKRINAETLSVDVIRKRADALALAEVRKFAVKNFFKTAVVGARLELFPGVIKKDGTVE